MTPPQFVSDMRTVWKAFLSNVWTIVVLCTQWGDSGKGKVGDLLAAMADIIVRCVGGPNTGNTVCINGVEYVLHLLPAGIFYPAKLNIIGSGVALDPRVLLEEITALTRAGVTFDNLRISLRARLILPQHLVIDRLRESSGRGKLGTTGRGVGTCYEDHVARVGLTVNDLLNPRVFRKKLARNLARNLRVIRTYDPKLVRAIAHHELLEYGAFFHSRRGLDIDAIAKHYLAYGRKLKRFITDTDAILATAKGKKRILLMGSQGNLLDIEEGTYPFVTAANCAAQGLAKGAGLHEQDITHVIGVVKAPYMTRVGEGPFPTELGGEQSAAHCRRRGMTRQNEAKRYSRASLDDPDDFVRGIAIREKGREFGATTGRPRRVGWLDLPALRCSMRFTGRNVALTKLDVFDEARSFKICDYYIYTGPRYRHGHRVFEKGDRIDVAITDPEIMRHCHPHCVTLRGWHTSIRAIREFGKLPLNCRRLVRFIEENAGVHVTLISTGPDREDIIFVKPPKRG